MPVCVGQALFKWCEEALLRGEELTSQIIEVRRFERHRDVVANSCYGRQEMPSCSHCGGDWRGIVEDTALRFLVEYPV